MEGLLPGLLALQTEVAGGADELRAGPVQETFLGRAAPSGNELCTRAGSVPSWESMTGCGLS